MNCTWKIPVKVNLNSFLNLPQYISFLKHPQYIRTCPTVVPIHYAHLIRPRRAYVVLTNPPPLRDITKKKKTLTERKRRERENHPVLVNSPNKIHPVQPCTHGEKKRWGERARWARDTRPRLQRMTRSYRERMTHPWGVDKIIIGPIIVPSTSRGGFFPFVQCSYTFVHLTSVHCPTYNPPPTVCPVVSSWSGPSNPPLDTCIRSRARERERERERLAEVRRSELGWLIILLNRKKGSPAIILPAYDVLSIVCHGHCDIRARRAVHRGWGQDCPIRLTKCT